MKKVQLWIPDTHRAAFLTEYDTAEPDPAHRCIRAVIGEHTRTPDFPHIHGDETHVGDAAHTVYTALHAEHRIKNLAHGHILASMPVEMCRPKIDTDGEPVLGDNGEPVMVPKDKHAPQFVGGVAPHYQFVIPGIDADHPLPSKLQTELRERHPGADIVVIAKPKG